MKYLDHIPGIYFCCDDQGIILEANAALLNSIDYGEEELCGKNAEFIFTISTRIFQQTHLAPLLRMQGKAEEIFVTLLAKNKEHIPILLTAERKIIGENYITFYAGLVVKNRKKFEDELIAAKKLAEASLNENSTLIKAREENKKHLSQLDRQIGLLTAQNQELMLFNRFITHDLKEPLRKISVFSSMLGDFEKSHRGESSLNKLRKTISEMLKFIERLQTFGLLSEYSGDLMQIDPNEIIADVLIRIRNEFPAVEIRVTSEEIPVVKGYKNQIQLLFYELLFNAAWFRKDGGAAEISITSSQRQRNSFLHIEDEYNYTNYLRIEIKDAGIGFDPAYKDRLFNTFTRLHTRSRRGLGLALCKRIINAHYGMIEIDGRTDKGVSVAFYLPFN